MMKKSLGYKWRQATLKCCSTTQLKVNRNRKKKDMALVNLAKFAIFAFLICTMASPFGSGAEMVIKEVVTNIDENCSKVGERTQIKDVTKQLSCKSQNQSCFPEIGQKCCKGLRCKRSYPFPGVCIKT